MFNNIGGKIKGLAAFICWVGIIASILGGIVLMLAGDEMFILIGIAVAIVGSLASWIGSFVMYGYGQLIYNSDIVARNTQNGNYNPSQLLQGVQPVGFVPGVQAVNAAPVMQTAPVSPAAPHQWKCVSCGNMISKEICPFCGKPYGKAVEKIEILQNLLKDGTITEEEYNSKLEKLRYE